MSGTLEQAAIRGQLNRILASPAFVRANRSSQLLRYLVESTLDGRQNDLKEYTIATEAFGKPASFDPRVDTLVRVEATRLRGRLQLYYETADDGEIEITLPSGSYIPAFVYSAPGTREESSPPHNTQPAAPASQARRISWRWVALGLALVGGILAFRFAGPKGAKPLAPLPPAQQISIAGEVLLFPALSATSRHFYFASNRGGGGFRIWRQTLDGNGAQPLTPPESDAYDLDLSPDDRWLTYWSSRHGGSIYQQEASGGEELLVTSEARSPRFSPDGKFIVYWKEGTRGAFGSVFVSGVIPGTHEREPAAVAQDFDDAHNPQWTPDGHILLCGTRRTNVPAMEHDLWIVGANQAARQEPVKTGILPLLSEHGIALHVRPFASTSFRLHNRTLLLSGVQKGMTRIFRLALTSDWKPAGLPSPLEEDGQPSDNASIRNSMVAYSTLRSNLNIWNLPLDADGKPAGAPRRLTGDPGEEFQPALPPAGEVIHYIAYRPPRYEIWRKDTASGLETAAYQSSDIRMVRASPDGRSVFFRTLSGNYPQRQAILRLETGSNKAETVCEDCGLPTSVSSGAGFVVYETGSRISRIAVFDVKNKTKRDILIHPNYPTQLARLSPDGRWLAFELDKGIAGRQVVVAPFRQLDEIPEQSWVTVTEQGVNMEPAWNVDGTALYFLSNRLGSRDLWMQRLDPATKRPSGPPQLVFRFRNASLTPLTYSERSSRYIGLSVGAGQAVLTLSELSSGLRIANFD